MNKTMRLCMLGLAFAWLVGTGCGKPDGKADVKKDPAAALVGKKWAGIADGQAVEIQFNQDQNGVQAVIHFTYFGKPGVMELSSVDIGDDSSLVLTGRSYKRLAGFADFRLDTLTGRLSADGTVISGGTGSEPGAFSVSSTVSLAEIDPPLDMKMAEDVLVKGKWEGRLGTKPAKLVFKKTGDRLGGQFTYGNARVNLSVLLAEDGTLAMMAQERPSPQGLVLESFSGKLSRDLGYVFGLHDTEIKQGFVTSSYQDQWVLENKKKP